MRGGGASDAASAAHPHRRGRTGNQEDSQTAVSRTLRFLRSPMQLFGDYKLRHNSEVSLTRML